MITLLKCLRFPYQCEINYALWDQLSCSMGSATTVHISFGLWLVDQLQELVLDLLEIPEEC